MLLPKKKKEINITSSPDPFAEKEEGCRQNGDFGSAK
jgi:hypothetical protein